MNVDEINTRLAAISEEMEQEGADLDALTEEVKQLRDAKAAMVTAEEKRQEIRKAVAEDEQATVMAETEEPKEVRNMSDMETRNSKAYIDAYANYIKTEDDTEVRALLTENAASGTIPVPEVVYDIVKNAWSRNGVIARVRRLAVAGNLKVGFEISATGATVHTEGGDPVTEEELVLGTVEIIPKSIKKWISVSDEALDLRGSAFLEYIYDELVYQIAKKAQSELLTKIIACGTVSTATAVGVPVVATASIALGTIASAVAELSEQAANPIVVMNHATWSAFKAVQYGASYAVDPFEGLDVEFDSTLPSFSAATSGDTFAIVGDFAEGALITEPAGGDVRIKLDENTLATNDLVRVIGRQFIGIGVVGPNCFVKIAKPSD